MGFSTIPFYRRSRVSVLFCLVSFCFAFVFVSLSAWRKRQHSKRASEHRHEFRVQERIFGRHSPPARSTRSLAFSATGSTRPPTRPRVTRHMGAHWGAERAIHRLLRAQRHFGRSEFCVIPERPPLREDWPRGCGHPVDKVEDAPFSAPHPRPPPDFTCRRQRRNVQWGGGAAGAPNT